MTAPDQPTYDDPTAPTAESDAGAPAAQPASGEGAAPDDLARQLEELRDRYLRLAAEYDNHRRRTQRERAEAGGRAQADLVKHLLDALDDLGRFAHVDPASTDAATVVEGVAMVEKKLLKALGSAGLQVVDPVGQPFDPSVHEAVATEPASGRDDENSVARVYQLGYVFAGQLLRPARVVVRQ